MSITEDSTAPATKTWTGAWTSAQTTASFTASSGTLIIALLAASGISPSQTVTGTITDSLSGGWTLLKRENSAQTNEGGTVEVWVRNGGGVGTAAPGAMTVSATGTGSPSTGGQLKVLCLLGADITANQNGATGSAAFNNSAAVQISVAAGTGNKIYGAAFNWSNSTNMTALANSSVVAAFSDATNGDSWEAFRSTGDTAGTATYGYSTSTIGRIAAVEFKAGVVAAASPTPFIGSPGFTSPQTLASKVTWDWNPAAAVTVTTQALPPQPPTPRRWLVPWAKAREAQPPPAAFVFTVQPPPQQPATPRRPRWLPRAKTRQAQPPPVIVTVPPQPVTRRVPFRPPAKRARVTTPVTVYVPLPQQTSRDRLTPPMGRRRPTGQTPPVQVAVTAQALPPQQPRPVRQPWLPRAKARQAQPVPLQIQVTAQALPPQQPVTRRPLWLARAKARQAQPPWPQVVVTVTPAPPQPPTRRRLFQPRPKPRTATPPLVTVGLLPPQQPVRRRLFQPRAKPRTGQPVPPQVIVFVPPHVAQPRRRWPLRWLFRRKGAVYQPPWIGVSGVREITIIPDLTCTRYSSDVTATRYNADTTSTRYGGGDMTGTRYSSDQTSTRYGADLNEQ